MKTKQTERGKKERNKGMEFKKFCTLMAILDEQAVSVVKSW